METPDTFAGQFTEMVMGEIGLRFDRHKMEKLTTPQYNRIYEAVLWVAEQEKIASALLHGAREDK